MLQKDEINIYCERVKTITVKNREYGKLRWIMVKRACRIGPGLSGVTKAWPRMV
jgi:hypothetical protein